MKLFIFDTSNIFYRAFYGNERMQTSTGIPTQALYGLVRSVQSICREYRPDLIAFAMEGGGESLRKAMYPEYKAGRTEPPDDLKLQLNMLPEFMQKMGYPVFKAPGYEADDVIATLTTHAVNAGLQVVVVSSDKDFCQLINEQVSMLNIAKNEMIGPMQVYQRYGVQAEQFLDYLSIVGDSADNIPGIKGIGPKGAADLISTYGSLDKVYFNIGMMKKGATLDKLVAGKEEAYFAQKMIQFIPIPGAVDFHTCKYSGPADKEVLRSYLRTLEFHDLEAAICGVGEVINMAGVPLGVRK